jgi:hypothetical protein
MHVIVSLDIVSELIILSYHSLLKEKANSSSLASKQLGIVTGYN